MAIEAEPALSDIDLGSLEFWNRPAPERDRSFAVLRREAPVSHHQPLEDVLGLQQRDERGYWAIVRYEDIRRISRDPATFCSGQGVQFGDAPPEMLEASQSFLAMDAPGTPSYAAWSRRRSPRVRWPGSRRASAPMPGPSSRRRRPPEEATSSS